MCVRASLCVSLIDIVVRQPCAGRVRSVLTRLIDVALVSQVIFGTGDTLGAVTTTANRGFVRAATQQVSMGGAPVWAELMGGAAVVSVGGVVEVSQGGAGVGQCGRGSSGVVWAGQLGRWGAVWAGSVWAGQLGSYSLHLFSGLTTRVFCREFASPFTCTRRLR